MSTVATTTPAGTSTGDQGAPVTKITLGWVLRDSWTEATRHLRIIPRNSELLVFSTIQPVIFVLNFRYVFGGAIGGSLPPGVKVGCSCHATNTVPVGPTATWHGHGKPVVWFASSSADVHVAPALPELLTSIRRLVPDGGNSVHAT